MSKKQKILVIEDDLELRGTLTDQLSLYEEYEAIAAENGNKGLQLAKTERIDLVIMDVGLPDIDGREAARILRRTGFKATLPFCRAASTGPYTASPVRDERGGGLYDRPLHISAKLETAPQFQRQQGPLDRKKTRSSATFTARASDRYPGGRFCRKSGATTRKSPHTRSRLISIACGKRSRKMQSFRPS
jgi:Response regulator receiver domain